MNSVGSEKVALQVKTIYSSIEGLRWLTEKQSLRFKSHLASSIISFRVLSEILTKSKTLSISNFKSQKMDKLTDRFRIKIKLKKLGSMKKNSSYKKIINSQTTAELNVLSLTINKRPAHKFLQKMTKTLSSNKKTIQKSISHKIKVRRETKWSILSLREGMSRHILKPSFMICLK